AVPPATHAAAPGESPGSAARRPADSQRCPPHRPAGQSPGSGAPAGSWSVSSASVRQGTACTSARRRSLDQGIDLPGADTVDIGFLHHGYQGPLRPPAGLPQTGEVAALPELGNPEGNGTEAGIPLPLPVAVAVGLALRGALIALGTDLLANFQFHQRLGQKPQTFPESIDLGGVLILAEQFQERYLEIGHRRQLPSRMVLWFVSIP